VRAEGDNEEKGIYADTLKIEYPRTERERTKSSNLKLQEMARRRHALAGLRGNTRTSRVVERMAASSFKRGRADI
jgi:hypothetical protein